MAIKKKYLKSKPVCKTTFMLPPDAVDGKAAVFLVGDFNGWDKSATPMRRKKDGAYSVTLDLPAGESFQFRYLIGQDTWENDWEADRYVPTPFGDAENSVVET